MDEFTKFWLSVGYLISIFILSVSIAHYTHNNALGGLVAGGSLLVGVIVCFFVSLFKR